MCKPKDMLLVNKMSVSTTGVQTWNLELPLRSCSTKGWSVLQREMPSYSWHFKEYVTELEAKQH